MDIVADHEDGEGERLDYDALDASGIPPADAHALLARATAAMRAVVFRRRSSAPGCGFNDGMNLAEVVRLVEGRP